MIRKFLIAACTATVFLAACSGGNDQSPPPVTQQVPDSASQSVAGLVDYLKLLVVASADTLEPVDISAPSLPTDDSSEPSVVD